MKNTAPTTLSPTMSLAAFENGYWGIDQLKHFAGALGVAQASKLRKDELETAILTFLRSGRVIAPTKRSLSKSGVPDLERGLSMRLRIETYTSNRATKDFIIAEAHKIAPAVRAKSGVWYRLNRW